MRLQNTLTLINGTLNSNPSISAFENIVVDFKKVARGDLFIAYDGEEIPKALERGAYGIVYDKDVEILDDEIAYMRVDSCDDALLRLLRFSLLNKNILAYECDKIVVELAKVLELDKNVTVLNSPLKESLKSILQLDNNTTVIYSSKELPKELFVDSHPMILSQKKKINIIEKTVFETSFIYDNRFFERIQISPFFIPYLQKLFNFLDELSLSYSFKSTLHVEHFKVVFCDKNFKRQDFGMSQKVLIFEKEMDLIKTQIEFLNSQASWAKMIYLIPSRYKDEFDKIEHVKFYEKDEDIFSLLKSYSYHYALIAQRDDRILDNVVSTKEKKQLVMEF